MKFCNGVYQGSATFWCCQAKIMLNNWLRALNKVTTKSGQKNTQKMFMFKWTPQMDPPKDPPNGPPKNQFFERLNLGCQFGLISADI